MQLPPRYRVLGLRVSRTDYSEVCDLVADAARKRKSFLVAHAPVHLVVSATRQAGLGSMLEAFDVVAPDGQPVRWALRLLHDCRLQDRVYGPFTMLHLCERAERDGIPVYLYGSTRAVLAKLERELRRKFPALTIAGVEAPPFRPLTAVEDARATRRINESGAGLVFVGLGCPKQDRFAFEHRDSIRAAQVCVGAAFDFLAGTKRMAPTWMQSTGLEWAFRLLSEPRRLWQRYLFTNTYFVFSVLRELALRARWRSPESKT
jgi:N-acetylglucosaminyldiphosphoundecaprenol N-acetyl-beta-D-mannosaminyltransferase